MKEIDNLFKKNNLKESLRPDMIKVNFFARDLKMKVDKAEHEELEFVDNIIQSSLKVSKKLSLGIAGKKAFIDFGGSKQLTDESISSFANKLKTINDEIQQKEKPK